MSEAPSLAPAGADRIVVRIAGDVGVTVPASLRVMSTYVLLEREDWFEDEIRFMRSMLKPGMTVLDIGANYGVYGLSAARCVGAGGRVIAFEPAGAVADAVRRSAEHNGFTNFTVLASAVGANSGRARLGGDGAELRTIVGAGPASGEEVDVIALDDWARGTALAAVDFVKIDVEGSEAAVVAGGRDFFATRDPLVMLEVWDGRGRYDFAAVRALRELGYRAYRLLPGPLVLAPLPAAVCDGSAAPEPFLINVFCCKPGRAERLANAGRLAASEDAATPPSGAGIALCLSQPAFAPLAVLGQRLAAGSGVPGDGAYRASLDAYAGSLAPEAPASVRAGLLAAACRALDEALQLAAPAPRLLSAMRIYAAYGRRQGAIAAAERMFAILRAGTIALPEPFVTAVERYALRPFAPDRLEGWLGAQTCEAYETLVTFSTWFFSRGTVDRVGLIEQAGWLDAAMERRRQLVRIAAGEQAGLLVHPAIAGEPACLNRSLWGG